MYLAGADFLGGPGLLESFTLLSYEQFLIDVESFKMMASLLEGFEINEETLAEDLTKKVGHEGHYMGEKQTVDVLRKSWRPKLTDVTPYATWMANGGKDIVKRAHEEAERILTSYRPEPLPEVARNKIRAILKEIESKHK
jgi:trimethylamine--corrinoid protein Co-methyltransferase